MVNDEKHFNQMIPDFSSRLKMKPGITGLSQSKGHKGLVRNMADIKRRYILDKFYGDNFTLKFDFIIMFNTIFDILRIKKK
jgi:lipopolysaccharide/colanic/teichoic acid biosynthesis glycosyltransferase